MSHTYNPFDPDYLDARQAERDEHALGLTEQHSPVPLELAADVRCQGLMDELDRSKNQRAPELPPAVAAFHAANTRNRRVAPIWSGPTTQEPLLGANRGDSIDMATPLHPDTARTLTRLLRQQNNEQAATSVERTQGYRW